MEPQNKQITTPDPLVPVPNNPLLDPGVDRPMQSFGGVAVVGSFIQPKQPFEPLPVTPPSKRKWVWLSVIVAVALLGGGGLVLAHNLQQRSHHQPAIVATVQIPVQTTQPNKPAQTTTQTPTTTQATPTKKTIPVQTTTGSSSISVAPTTIPGSTVPVNKSFGVNYYYAGARQFATAVGMRATMTIAKPSVPVEGTLENHSLMELAVGSVDGKQYVEVGWIVDPIWFKDTNPHLFVYHWVNGATSCYNGCGFVTVAGGTLPGATLTSGTTGVFEISYKTNGWYIYFNNTTVGYFPATLWSNTFTQAGFMQAFGEITLADANTNKCIQMGNGKAGTDSSSAIISDVALVGGPSTSLSPYYTSPSTYIYGFATVNSVHIGGPGSC